MIKRSHVRQFLAVVDAGSFTQAAARIRVTQPTLSIGIAELEKLVGVPLLIRDRRRVRLTEAGGRFLPIARALERSFQEADRFGEAGTADWPEIKFGMIRTIAGAAVQALIAALVPHFTLELVEGADSELRAQLNEGRLNLMLGLLRDGEAGPDVIELQSEPYAMLACANHPLAGKTEVLPEELASEVMIARRSCEVLDETSRFFTRHRVRPRFALRSDNDDRCLRMVAAGLGITNAPISMAIAGTVPLAVRGYNLKRRLGLRLGTGWHPQARARLIAASASLSWSA